MSDEMTEFQQRAAAVALRKMLSGPYFSVSDLDAIAETMGRKSSMGGQDYAALRALHCIHWSAMGPELAQMVRDKCCEMLGVQLAPIDVKAEKEDERPADKPKLAWWRKP